MRSFDESIRYPSARDDWYVTIAIGALLTIFSFLLIPILIVWGYLIRVIQGRLADEPKPPEFDDWVDLLVTGVKAGIIGIIYMLIPMIVAMLTVAGAVIAFLTGTEVGVGVGLLGLFAGLLVTFVLTLIFGYIAVAAIVNFAKDERIGDAFDFDHLKSILTTSEYAFSWVVGIGVILVASVIGGLLNVIPLLGFIIAAFVTFYAQVAAAGIWADGVEESLESVTFDESIDSSEVPG